MIRSSLKRVVRKLIGRSPAPPAAPPARSTPAHSSPSGQAPAAQPAEPTPAVAPEPAPTLEVTADEVANWMANDPSVTFVDIREPMELRSGHIRDAILIPMNSIPDNLAHLSRTDTLVLYCAAGMRSYSVTTWLRQQGYKTVWSLIGGFGAFAQISNHYLMPPSDARFFPMAAVRLARNPQDPNSQEHTAAPRTGTVQSVEETPDGHRYSVLTLDENDQPARLTDLGPDDLETTSPGQS